MIKERILLILCDPKSSLLTSVFTPVFTPLKRNILFSVTNLCLSGWESLTAAQEPHSNTRQSRVAKGHLKKFNFQFPNLFHQSWVLCDDFLVITALTLKDGEDETQLKLKGPMNHFWLVTPFWRYKFLANPERFFFFLSRIGFWPDIWIYADLIWTGFIAMNVKEHSLRWSFRIMIMII